jgi:hypothetical protein
VPRDIVGLPTPPHDAVAFCVDEENLHLTPTHASWLNPIER